MYSVIRTKDVFAVLCSSFVVKLPLIVVPFLTAGALGVNKSHT